MYETEPHHQPAPSPPPQHKPSKQDGARTLISSLGLLLLAPVVAFILTAFVFQSYEVDGPSMQSTLQNHDRLLVYKLQRTVARLTHHNYQPNRGDIVIFNHPEATDLGSSNRQLIKRVIALPGERVVVKDGTLTVYNSAHPEGFSPDATMPYGKVIGQTPGDVDLVVPAGTIFVCGDNRGNSLDSRYFGPVALEDVVGKLGVRIYPFNQFEVF